MRWVGYGILILIALAHRIWAGTLPDSAWWPAVGSWWGGWLCGGLWAIIFHHRR